MPARKIFNSDDQTARHIAKAAATYFLSEADAIRFLIAQGARTSAPPRELHVGQNLGVGGNGLMTDGAGLLKSVHVSSEPSDELMENLESVLSSPSVKAAGRFDRVTIDKKLRRGLTDQGKAKGAEALLRKLLVDPTRDDAIA